MADHIPPRPSNFEALQRIVDYSREEAERLGLDIVTLLLDMATSALDDAISERRRQDIFGVNEPLLRHH